METIIHTDPNVIEQLCPEWNALLHNSTADTPFLTYEWQKTWNDCLCSCEGEVHLLTVRDGGALLGIAPLFVLSEPDKDGRPQRLLRLIGSVDASDYLDLIAARGREREVFTAMLDVLERSDTWDAIDLWNVPEASMTRALLPELIASRGWKILDEKQVVCPIIQLPLTFDDYVQGLDKKERHELRRKIRRAEATEGVSWYAITGQDRTHDLDEAAESFISLMMKSRSDKSDFMTDDMRRFFHQMIHATHDGGFLHLVFLEVNGVKAATYLSFDYNQKRMVFNSGLETEGFQSLSAGIVLVARIIDEAIQLGYSEFDFLRGDEKYKYQLGAKDTWIYHVRVDR
ncbi:MAG TPA: GNAT family N-acetyltransferase [Anaerolineae bacterium]|nr:GNAT family N-acetyltransferase [Anaerolineae bacterium]